jgi:hypothetical protein
MLLKHIKVIVIFWVMVLNVKAQETPYYTPPGKRLKNHEIINMPFLTSKSISYYFGLTGGFKKAFIANYNASPLDIISNTYITGLWEVNFGQNRNDNLMFESGISHLKSSLNTTFMNIFRQPVIVSNEREQYFIPFRIKKKIITLDKITKSAFVNIGIGTAYTFSKSSALEKQTINFLLPKVPNPTDIKKLTIEKNTNKFPMLLEAFAELKGKVSERIELSIFVKSILKSPKDLSNNFAIEKVNGEGIYFGNFEKRLSISFGLQARLNSPKYLKYSSNVE